jgi:hypothetical protein
VHFYASIALASEVEQAPVFFGNWLKFEVSVAGESLVFINATATLISIHRMKESSMESVVASVVCCSGLLVPMLAVWAIAALYTQCSGSECCVTQYLFFGALLFIAGMTVRTVTTDDGCWLIHTTSLGAMIVAGVMRRPASQVVQNVPMANLGPSVNNW